MQLSELEINDLRAALTSLGFDTGDASHISPEFIRSYAYWAKNNGYHTDFPSTREQIAPPLVEIMVLGMSLPEETGNSIEGDDPEVDALIDELSSRPDTTRITLYDEDEADKADTDDGDEDFDAANLAPQISNTEE